MSSKKHEISYSNLSHYFFFIISIGIGITGALTILGESKPPQTFIWLIGIATFFFTMADILNYYNKKIISGLSTIIAVLMLCGAILMPINGFVEIPNFTSEAAEGLALIALSILLISFAFRAMNEGKKATEDKKTITEEKDQK